MPKKEKVRRHREKGRCSCGMKKRDLKVLQEHAKAKGHTIVKLPVASGGKYNPAREARMRGFKSYKKKGEDEK